MAHFFFLGGFELHVDLILLLLNELIVRAEVAIQFNFEIPGQGVESSLQAICVGSANFTVLISFHH